MATTVAAGFAELLKRLNLTATQNVTAKTHINNIVSFFKANLVMHGNGAFYTGSFRRGTMVRWTRDVDIMAPLSFSAYGPTYDGDSSKFLYMVRDALNDHFGSTDVSTKKVAVKVDYSDITADVVPCFPRQGGGYFMPDGRGGWRATNPPFHSTLMKEADEKNNLRLKPIARLMKAWNIANGSHLGSIHVGLMVERMWRDVQIGSTTSQVIASTLKTMPSWLQSYFADPWPDGHPIDEQLSAADRDMALRMLREDAGRAAQAEDDRAAGRTQQAFERWDVVFRGQFPAYG
jgi:hypothetical protein